MKTTGDKNEFYKVYKYTFPDGKIYVGVTKNTIQYRNVCVKKGGGLGETCGRHYEAVRL